MNAQETVVLCRLVKAACPQQAIDKYTPDAWGDLLGDLSFEDCKAAVITITKAQPFCAPSEIRAEVQRIRNRRLDRASIPAPPSELVDDWPAYQAALHASRVAAADGRDPEAAVRVVANRSRLRIEAAPDE